jgi:acyl-CoA synthetase (AMP-forming)/AMP-acid ligase II
MTRSPEAFAELLVRERVTVLNQTPSAFRALMRAPAIADGVGGRAIRYVILGGEALDAATIRPWLETYAGGGQLINMYGITETTVHVTFHRVTEADLGASASPIGRPIPDLEIRLLDEQQNPVPVGVPGEICVGGPGVARGYLKRPELTAQRFISDPLAPGQKLYRSGDLALRRADGTFDYLGRMDDQVKIRGFRIELGEIQSLIAEHPAVAEAHVAMYERSQDDKRIVAYVVPKEGASELVLSTLDHVRAVYPQAIGETGLLSSFNPTFDKSFHGPSKNSGYEFAPNVKFAYDVTKKLAMGLEYYGAYGPYRHWSPLREQEQAFLPAIDVDFGKNWEFNFGVGIGVTGVTDHLLIKMIVGYRFNNKNN